MQYPCKTISLLQVPKTSQGIVEPLCNSCLSRDCDNPIEKRSVSLPHGKKDWRVMTRGNNISVVLQCQGYQGRK